MTVAELARRAEVPPHVVRYYSRRGLLRPTRDPENGYRHFAEGDAQRLRFIHRAKLLGYTLTEISQILKHAGNGHATCPMVREILQRRITENRRKVEEMLSLQRRMEHASKQWERMPDRLSSGESVCHLIESVGGDLADGRDYSPHDVELQGEAT